MNNSFPAKWFKGDNFKILFTLKFKKTIVSLIFLQVEYKIIVFNWKSIINFFTYKETIYTRLNVLSYKSNYFIKINVETKTLASNEFCIIKKDI